jgi:hypothetical protein
LHQVLSRGKGTVGERMVRFYIEDVFVNRGPTIKAMLRTALADPDSIPTLRKLIQESLVATAASALRALMRGSGLSWLAPECLVSLSPAI